MARDREDSLQRLLSGALPFPERGRVFLVDTGSEFLAREATEAVGDGRLVIVERRIERHALLGNFPAIHAERAEPGPGDMVVLPAGRERLRLFLDLEHYAGRIGPQGQIAIFGTRKEGMHPAEALLRDHCRELSARQKAGARLLVVKPREGEEDWSLDASTATYSAEARSQSVTVCALPGVFSWDRLDDASTLMLNACKPREGDHLLDLGCGSGVVSCILLKEGLVTSATLVDSDALALVASRRSLELGGFQGALIASDAGDELPAKSFDLALCNPPYHSGSMQERGTGRRMIDNIARALSTKGRLYLVGPVFHDHSPELERLFRYHEVAAQTPSFRVWHASRPRRNPRKE
ncbi:methyltransferase [bacterium]|nr:methyltransferase [bacterium]